MKRWESIGAALYYGLGTSFYFYHWLILTGIAGGTASVLLRHRVVYFVLLLTLSMTSTIGGVTAWFIRTKKRLNFLNPDLAVTRLVDTYRTDADDKYVYEKEITVQALRSNVSVYSIKFRWSGKGTIALNVEPRQDLTATLTKSPDDWDVVRVQLTKPLARRQKKSFTLTLNMTDQNRTALPFCQKFIDDSYPRGLTMRAILLTPPKKICKEIFLAPRSELAIYNNEQKPRNNSHEIVWRIRKPIPGRRYRLSWT
jgi:hypothetical protein